MQMGAKLIFWTAVFFVLFFPNCCYCTAKSDSELSTLRAFFTATSHTREEIESAQPQMIRIALDLGSSAIPILTKAITHSEKAVSEIAISCLIYIGGAEVKRLFQDMYTRTNDLSFKAAFCLTMASSGPSQDIPFLIDALEGERFGAESIIPVTAAYSLAVLRPEQARAALEKRAEKYQGAIPEEVKFALARIKRTPWKTPQAKTALGIDSVIFSVMRFGIPYLEASDRYVDRKAHRIWKRTGNEWFYKTDKNNMPGLPSLMFDVFVTSHGNRSICSVSIGCGNVCGYGYDFILRKENNEWQVVGLIPTYVS
ncbi:MAG TPA: hypothetical protein VMT62_15590 [Syntrophorhabdaceae bacterium]|nr:hypothetical protein [Syntrophorhabdaceae bacterium]